LNFEEHHLYKVLFFDHCVGLEECMKCEVVGFVTKDSDNCVTFTHWIVRHEDLEMIKDNVEHTTILKAAIIDIEKLD